MRASLARRDYASGTVRMADPDLTGQGWLVTSPKGLFAVSPAGARLAVYGWFFGLCRYRDWIFLFDNCGHRHRSVPRGRLLRIALTADRLHDPVVLATGLDCRCHQLAVIDGLLCLLDTANQAILRFDLDGRPVDVRRPFAPARGDQPTGYHHINAIAPVQGRIAIMLHNGRQQPAAPSAIAWLDRDWRLIGQQVLAGFGCHDLVEDEAGILWHCDSMAGAIVASTGRRIVLSERWMTRGLALSGRQMMVGLSMFGPRSTRDKLDGTVVVIDGDGQPQFDCTVAGPPAAIVSLG